MRDDGRGLNPAAAACSRQSASCLLPQMSCYLYTLHSPLSHAHAAGILIDGAFQSFFRTVAVQPHGPLSHACGVTAPPRVLGTRRGAVGVPCRAPLAASETGETQTASTTAQYNSEYNRGSNFFCILFFYHFFSLKSSKLLYYKPENPHHVWVFRVQQRVQQRYNRVQ